MALIRPGEVVNGGMFRKAPINARFDVSILGPAIPAAMRKWVKPVICIDLYEDMVSEMNPLDCNYGPPLPTVQKFLSNAPYELIWTDGVLYELCCNAVTLEAYPNIYIHASSKGLEERGGLSASLFREMVDSLRQKTLECQVAVKEYLDGMETPPVLYNCHVTDECEEDKAASVLYRTTGIVAARRRKKK